jgi:hypothetical protein
MSAEYQGDPVPSMICPLTMTRSKLASVAGNAGDPKKPAAANAIKNSLPHRSLYAIDSAIRFPLGL